MGRVISYYWSDCRLKISAHFGKKDKLTEYFVFVDIVKNTRNYDFTALFMPKQWTKLECEILFDYKNSIRTIYLKINVITAFYIEFLTQSN